MSVEILSLTEWRMNMTGQILKSILRRPCIVWKYLGIYCPGCGGTRAAKELLRGHILKSLWYHPLVLYLAVVLGWYLLSNGIQYLTKEKRKIGMQMHNRYLYIGLAIVVINWIVRNLLLVIWGITL